MAPACSKCPAWPWQTGVGTGDHQCRGSPQPMSRARRFRPRARGGLACLLLGLLVVVDVLPRAEAAYSCTSDGDCAYEGCNDNSCTGWESHSRCNNGVWDVECYDYGYSTGKACVYYGYGYGGKDTCPDPPAGWPPTPTTTPAPTTTTTQTPSIKCENRTVWQEVPVEVEKIIYVNRTQVFEVPVEIEKIVYINQTIEVEKVIEVPVEIEKIVYINQTIEVEKVIEVPVEKIIRAACGEDQLANHTKNGGNRTKNWGRPGYTHCEQPYVWRELIYGYKDSKVALKAGGLGTLLERGGYQTWVCIDGHFCGDPWFCWVYHETNEVFTPWGTNSELLLVKE